MFGSIALVVAAGLLGPLLAAGRRPLVPVLLGELAAGVVLGRTGFHLIEPSATALAAFLPLGFAMLMLGAGGEVDLGSPEFRRGLSRGLAALVAAFVAGSSAAVAYPTIEERGLSAPPIGMLLAWIALADALTALLMPLTLSAGNVISALAGDAAIIMLAAGIAILGERLVRNRYVDAVERQSRQRRWALQLRVSILFLFVLAAIADRTGGSLLVAGFAAGLVLRRLRPPQRLELQLSGLANGFFVPAFFVLVGAGLDLKALFASPAAVGLALAMAVGAAVVHLAAAVVAASGARIASGLLASAQLGLPAAAATLGVSSHALSPAIGAALVAGGCLTLIPANIGSLLLARGAGQASAA